MTKQNGYKILVEFFFFYISLLSAGTESYVRSGSGGRDISRWSNFSGIFTEETIQRRRLPWSARSSTAPRPQLPPSQLPPPQLEKATQIAPPPPGEPTQRVKLKKKEKKILKKYKDFLDILPKRDSEYAINEAIEKIKTLAVHKFVESIDIYLSFNQKRSKMNKNDNLKTFITFPHNLKKKREKKVYVVTNRDLQKRATDSGKNIPSEANFLEGADVVGEDDLISKIKEREIRLKKKNNNFLLCTNDVIHKLARVGKEVGSKGLMPNEKSGTLVSEFLLEKHVKLFKFGNSYIFKLNKLNTLNLNVGDVYMSNDEIRENICHLFEHLDSLEFFHFNSKNLKSVFLSSTMGFPFKIKRNFL
ncbi:50S ribosomal protein L1 [Plasmodium vivax India VII]|uniref:50S ribosomal protein L1, putative n=4 Tax=Plasmodium vivax TaxID=5855 RepID=A5K0J8_PLAVS|nr:50S ribosomal protein L1, putative [Plasmodium vivax]EDL46845.1 50S ribosomal protein L1, putative [Plasmodium vivax]KMZ78444.1 50S ribosomal protein L1 [Plasmodium vivax India VII]KMZ90832.1 50S ribosomal protein L1 [Plasmodium vivax Mauritania I]KMZ97616.1 50S ribosomal protein L1 [Plasmodium vivax North Korean]|eukprot:XP_001616572.1 50S ribosomal protein L1 [Plasmodium vivax Sal-1]